MLVVTQYFWPERFRINDLVTDMKARGYEVTVLTGKPNYPTGQFFSGYGFLSRSKDEYQGVTVHRAPLIPRGKGQNWRLALNYLSFAFFAAIFAPFRCREDFDVIFVYEPSPVTVCLPAIVLKWLRRKPLILWVGDPWPESLSATGAVESRFVLGLVEKMVTFIYRQCDLVLVQSQAFVPSVTARGADTRKVHFFPNWAESLYQVVTPSADAQEREQMPEGFCVMFAGNIGTAQSFETILAAAVQLKENSDIHWVILGEGLKKSWVEAQVEPVAWRAGFTCSASIRWTPCLPISRWRM